MDPITIAAIAALIAVGLFIIIKLVRLTAPWFKNKLQELLENKKGVIVLTEHKLKELLSEAVGEDTVASFDELDVMIASIDENNEIKDIEFISADEGVDESVMNLLANHGDIIHITNNA